MAGEWQLLRLAGGAPGGEWQLLRASVDTGSATAAQWQLLRASVSLTSGSFLLADSQVYEAGETATITASRGSGSPFGRTWRVAATSGVTTTPFPITNVADVATMRMPISATDCTVTVGYKPSDGPEIFITLSARRAVDWVRWGGFVRPAVWHVGAP